MPTVFDDRPHDVERVAAEAREALAADGGQDGVDEPVEARDLVGRAGPPVLDRVHGRTLRVRGRRVGEQVHVGANHRERRPQLVGHDREQLRTGRVQLRQPVELRLRLRLHPALLDDPREEGGDRGQELLVLACEVAEVTGLDVEHADDRLVPDERHGQHRVEPWMSKPRTHEKRGSVVTSRDMTGMRSAAARPVSPSPRPRLTRPTWLTSSPFVAASVRRSPSRSRR